MIMLRWAGQANVPTVKFIDHHTIFILISRDSMFVVTAK